MKIKSIISIAAFGLCVSASAFAAKDSTVTLTGGTMSPAQPHVLVSLSPLVQYVTYDVTCSLVDSNNAKNQAIISAKAGENGPFIKVILNQSTDVTNNNNITLPQVNNTITVYNINQTWNNIIFSSADQSDSVVVENCSAVAEPKAQ